MATPPTPEELQKQINELKNDIADLRKEIKGMESDTRGVNTELGKSKNLFKEMVEETINVGTHLKEVATSLQKQYTIAEELAKKYKETAVNIGLSVNRTNEFGIEFGKAASKVAQFGADLSDVRETYQAFISETGRARIINADEIEKMVALQKATGDFGTGVIKMFESMELMGVSVIKSSEMLDKLIVDSQKMGLNSNKVIRTLSENMDRMQTLSFRNGVQGMTKMAQLAVKMRMDVGEMLGMAEKFYEPEAAIEAAANLQMLGGDIAEAFGDPFETMYLARNKPEELAERVAKMTENMVQFNEKTGEVDFPAEARMQLKAVQGQLDVNVDSLLEMSKQAAKIKNIKMQVDGNILDEDVREGIAGLARMDKDNNWVVDFKGEELKLDEIGPDIAKDILAAPQDEKDAAIQTALNTRTIAEGISDMKRSGELGIVSKPGTNVYMEMEKLFRPMQTQLMTSTESLVNTIGETFGGEGGWLKTSVSNMEKATEIMGGSAAKGVEIFFKGLEEIIKNTKAIQFEDVKVEILNLQLPDTTNIDLPDTTSGGIPKPTLPDTTKPTLPDTTINAPITINVDSSDREMAQEIANQVQLAINGLMNRNYGGVSI